MISRLRRTLVLLLLLVPALSAQLSAQTQTESFRGRDAAAGEIIVRFRGDGIPNAAQGALSADIVATLDVTSSRTVLLRSSGRNVSDLLQEYSGRPDVLYAEPNYILRKEDIPNDVSFGSQWGLRNTGQTIAFTAGTPGADIHAVQAWDIAQGTRSVVIGITDTGVDYNHPDLAANMWSAPAPFTVVIGGQSISCAAGTHGFNAILKTCNPMDDDPDWHGTHVAGIIGADGDNGLGVSGVSRVASMIGLKFIGSNGTGTTADAIAAISFAIQVKATFGAAANIRILNASWGGTNFSQALLDAINLAATNDMLFVAGAGNESVNNDQSPHYPSSFNAANIISVAATDNRDALSVFSNFGATSVHLGAPGTDIASTLADSSYMLQSGTSMATPMVSGAAGLVLSACPNQSTAQLKASLLGSVDPVGSLQSKTLTGGRLNAYNALLSCAGTPPTFTLRSSSSLLLPDIGGSATMTITENPLNGFSSEVALVASAPPGFTVSLGSSVLNTGSPSTLLTVTADSSVAPGTYVIHVTGTSGNTTRSTGAVFVVGTPISAGQNLLGTLAERLDQPNRFSPDISQFPPGVADWYQVAVNSTTSLNISLLCFVFSGNQLRLLDSSGNVLVLATTPSNNTLQITRTVTPGVYFIVASAGPSFGNDRNYSLAVNAPQLRSISPNSGEQGASVTMQFFGAQFTSGLTVDAGSDIAVSNIVFVNSGQASATFAISAAATLGTRPIRVNTSAGSSNSETFTVVPARPVISSVSPLSGVVGTSVDITILGSNFINPTVEVISPPPGPTLDNIVVVSPSMITARLTIPANSTIGFKSIRVTTSGGFSTVSFQVVPLPPTLTSITPASGSLGSTVDVALTGSNFFSSITINVGAGITVSNLSVSQDGTTATARFNISITAVVGTRNITITTTGGTSGPVSFTVTPGSPPTLTSISPAQGGQTVTRNFDVLGTNFTSGFVFNPGPDITVTAVTIVNSTRATVTLQIGSAAALGPRDVTVSTPGGTSNSVVFTVLIPPPTLTSFSPSSGVQQSTFSVTLTGTNFVPGLTINGVGSTFSQIVVIDSTSATAVMTIPANTTTGPGGVSVSTASGPSNNLTFVVLPGVPTLTSISPVVAVRGRLSSFTLLGTNFIPGSTTISAIPGVTISIFTTSGGSIGANFDIPASTPLGPQALTVTTPGGTTGSVTLTIVDPFPDLVLGYNGNNAFWAGLNGTYGITIINNGTAPTSKPVTLTDALPPELTYVSSNGPNFSCSANGQLVTCTYSPPIVPFFGATVNITVALSPTLTSPVSHTMSVILDEDLDPSNNSISRSLVSQVPPAPTFVFTPSSLTAGQQGTVALFLPVNLPQDMTGTLTLNFSSTASNPGDDPAIQFATGGRQVSFVIPANSTQARFGSASVAGPVGYQAGTVAGSVSFSGIARVGTFQRSFASNPGISSLVISPIPPVIQSVRGDSQNGFALLITSFSTPRSMTEMSLQFNTIPSVPVGCGSAPGCSASGSTLTLDVKGIFDTWFTGSSQAGGLSTLRLPLSIQGKIRGSVGVTLKNALGSSNQVFFTLP